jgi:hypothetical protein
MALFAKIKQFFGFVGVKVELSVPEQTPKASGAIPGKIALQAEQSQQIVSLKVSIVEEWSIGRGEEKTEKRFELGEVMVAQDFSIGRGERREFEFTLPFELVKSNQDRLMDKGGALGALGALGKFAGGEKSTFRVIATADVAGAALDPNAVKDIRLVN